MLDPKKHDDDRSTPRALETHELAEVTGGFAPRGWAARPLPPREQFDPTAHPLDPF